MEGFPEPWMEVFSGLGIEFSRAGDWEFSWARNNFPQFIAVDFSRGRQGKCSRWAIVSQFRVENGISSEAKEAGVWAAQCSGSPHSHGDPIKPTVLGYGSQIEGGKSCQHLSLINKLESGSYSPEEQVLGTVHPRSEWKLTESFYYSGEKSKSKFPALTLWIWRTSEPLLSTGVLSPSPFIIMLVTSW